MGKLHELLPIEADLQSVANNMIAEAATTFSHRADHFKGLSQTTSYLAEDRSSENTKQEKAVVTSVDDKLAHLVDHVTRYYDVIFQKELANQNAKADLVVNGQALIKDVPAPMLLGLESRLKAVRQALQVVPTLDPAMLWQEDANLGKGHYRSPTVTTFKTEKALKFQVLAPATDKHPAQVKDWQVDQNVARIDTTHISAMWPVAKKAAVLHRIDTLIQAVKQARARANLAEAPTHKIGKILFDYILPSE